MRDLSKILALIPVLPLAMSAPAAASNFWETLFGMPAQRAEAPFPAARPAKPPQRAARPRQAKASGGVLIRSKVRVMVTHGGGADAAAPDYLRSQDFTRRFSLPSENATREALAYLARNDATLRAGDAVVTRAGVQVFDEDRRAFSPARQKEAYLAQSRPAPAKAAAAPAFETAPAAAPAPLAFSVRVTDGQPIRFVGGL